MLVEDAFEKTGIDPMARPETLSMAQFVALSDQMVA
jgi:16S rRNA (adenine1518-N6/adenine1519-N6)-dimethyltransferase